MTFTAKDLLKFAASEIGIKEDPMGSNNVIFNTWFYGHPVYGKNYAWCAVKQCFDFNHFGKINLLVSPSAACRVIYAGMKSRGLEVQARDVKPGDIVFFMWAGDSEVNHIGIVESISGNTVITIEGNTSDQVMRKARVTNSSGYKLYFCRPQYDVEQPEKPDYGSEGKMISKNIEANGEGTFYSYTNKSQGAVTYFNITNDGDKVANVKIQIQVENGDYGNKTLEIPVSAGNPKTTKDPQKSQGVVSFEAGALFDNNNIGGVRWWISTDQPISVFMTKFQKTW